ncbi:MAG: type II toxin-antitoxin system RelE/ParE family toxin [Oscillospiraceae bacterium]|jgi:plasmid stabilization system protein ParE|nr:type II toxin-antitoxin system RelE/ParE family toxin [Oscillospiraceae bacterium]
MPADASSFNLNVHIDVRRKLNSHVSFLANVSVSASVRLRDEFAQALRSLRRKPHRYPKYYSPFGVTDELRYRFCSKQRYRIVFKVVDNTVYIIDVQDCRQDTEANYV